MSVFLLVWSCFMQVAAAAAPAPVGPHIEPYCAYLSGNLCRVLELAMEANVGLKADSQAALAKEGRLSQAAALPNPVVTADGSQREGQYTVQIGQTFELGDKRQKRMQLAATEYVLAVVGEASRRLDIIQDVKIKFVEVLVGREQLALANRRLSLSRELHGAVQRRLDMGSGMRVEVTKARLAVTEGELKVRRWESKLAAANRQLCVAVGLPDVMPFAVVGRLSAVQTPPQAQVIAPFAKAPLILRASQEIERRQAALAIEKAKSMPDITVSTGLRYFAPDRAMGIVFGLSIPLAVLDHNRGGIHEANSEILAAELRKEHDVIQAKSELSDLWFDMENARDEIKVTHDQLLPDAEKALSETTEAFRRGKVGYLLVIDSQRGLFDIEESYVQALAAFHKAIAGIEHRLGQGIGTWMARDLNH